jgi:hypothetical protein
LNNEEGDGNSSEKFVPFNKTGGVTSQKAVLLIATLETPLNLTIFITLTGAQSHFKVSGLHFLRYGHEFLFCPLHFTKILSSNIAQGSDTTLKGFSTKSILFGCTEIRQRKFLNMATQRQMKLKLGLLCELKKAAVE